MPHTLAALSEINKAPDTHPEVKNMPLVCGHVLEGRASHPTEKIEI